MFDRRPCWRPPPFVVAGSLGDFCSRIVSLRIDSPGSMNFLTSLQADRLIAQIRERGRSDLAHAARRRFEKLGKLGNGAVPKILEALASADKRQTVEYVELLSSLINDKTLPLVTRGLADADPKTVSGTAWALSSSRQYNVNRLVDLLGEDEFSKAAIIEVLTAHKERLNVRQLLGQIYFLQPSEKAAVFKLIDDIMTEELVPDLLATMDGKDPVVKMHLINVLARFDRPDVDQGPARAAARSQQARSWRRAWPASRSQTRPSTWSSSPDCCSTPTSR